MWQKTDLFGRLTEAKTPADMRAAIEESQRIIPVVRQVLMTARIRGLSAEDTYSMLAYHALQQMQNLSRTIETMIENDGKIPVLLDVIEPDDRSEKDKPC